MVLLLLTPPALAQALVSAGELPRVQGLFESRPGAGPLPCEVTPLPPSLNFALRYRAGYTFHVPQSQSQGSTRGWSVLTAITPEGGAATYLFARTPLSSATRVDASFNVGGLYFLGTGRYSVEAAIRDDRNRVCRKQWHILVRTARADRAIPSALPAFAVRPISVSSWPDTRHIDNTAPVHLSVLVNAAAFSSRRTAIRPSDRLVLVEALTAMLEHLPAASVRLVVFSLEQQREVFRSDAFSLALMSKVGDAIAALQLSTVDVHLLQNPLGHVDFLEQLINRELTSDAPVDTVIFLGPPSRYANKIPAAALRTPAFAHPRVFYLQYQGPRRLAMPPNNMDTPLPGIGQAGRALQGMPTAPGTSTESTDPMSAAAPVPPRLPPPTTSQTSSTDGTGNSTPGSTPSPGAGSGGSGGGGRGGRGGAGRGLPPMPPAGEHDTDIINTAVARLKGKTLAIHTPAELAKAIRKIEQKKK